MSHTVHHRKPGTPRKPAKRHLAHGRADAQLRISMLSGDDTIGTFEPTSMRRTR